MLAPKDREAIWSDAADDTHPWHQGVSNAHRAVDRAEEEHAREVAKVDWLVVKMQADAPKGRELEGLMRAYRGFCDAALRISVPFEEVQDLYTIAPLSEAGFEFSRQRDGPARA